MTDDHLLMLLEDIKRFIEEPHEDLNSTAKLSIVRMTVVGMIKAVRSEGYERIPKLISDLATKGAGFPPESGMN